MIKIPGTTRKWVQPNTGDLLGNLWSSFNIDLQSNMGSLRVSPRLKINKSTTDLANLGVPVAFKGIASTIATVAGSRVFFSDEAFPNSPFTEDASGTASTDYSSDYSDLEIFNKILYSSAPSKIRSLASVGGVWTDRHTFGVTNYPHKLCYFKKFNRLYAIASRSSIISLDTANVVATEGDYFISWGAAERVAVTDIKASSDAIWIAGKPYNVGRQETATVWQWDGISPNITKEYKIAGCHAIFAMAIDEERNVPVVMGDNGVLYELSGAGFVEIGRLPYTTHLPYAGANPYSSSAANDRFIHPNGLIFTKDHTILALINGKNGDNAGTQNENIPSGVWEWSAENGFVHKYSLSYDPASTSISDFGQFQVSRVGAIADMNWSATNSGRDGTILVGASYFTNASSTSNAIFFDNSLDTIRKAGYFVTTKIKSPKVQDYWEAIHTLYDHLLTSTDKIVVKYRTKLATATNISITWVNTTSFTTTTDVSGMVGYEVEILNGTGGGLCAHIVSVVNNAGTYTVTIDETATGATTGTAKARVQNWIKADSIQTQSINFSKKGIQKSANWIQFKVFMLWTGKNDFDELVLTSKSPAPNTQL